MRWKPCGFMVLVKPEYEKELDWGPLGKFVIAESDRRGVAQVQKGKVVAIGPTAWRAYDDGQRWCEVGDTVMYTRWAGAIIENPDKKDDLYVLLPDADIRAVLKEEDNG